MWEGEEDTQPNLWNFRPLMDSGRGKKVSYRDGTLGGQVNGATLKELADKNHTP